MNKAFTIGDRVSYYPCDICGNNIPGNKTVTKNGITTAYCPRHWMLHKEEVEGPKKVKKKEEFLDNFRKAFVNVDTTMNGSGIS